MKQFFVCIHYAVVSFGVQFERKSISIKYLQALINIIVMDIGMDKLYYNNIKTIFSKTETPVIRKISIVLFSNTYTFIP